MNQQKIKKRIAERRPARGSYRKKHLDMILGLDRVVLERSMCLYNVLPADRSLLRAHNRRLHKALRKIHRNRLSSGVGF